MKTLINYKNADYSFLLIVVLLAMNLTSVTATDISLISSNSDSSFYSSLAATSSQEIIYVVNNSKLASDELLLEEASLARELAKIEKHKLFFEELENELSLEDWMLSSNHDFWDNILREDREGEIIIEDWMVDASLWE